METVKALQKGAEKDRPTWRKSSIHSWPASAEEYAKEISAPSRAPSGFPFGFAPETEQHSENRCRRQQGIRAENRVRNSNELSTTMQACARIGCLSSVGATPTTTSILLQANQSRNCSHLNAGFLQSDFFSCTRRGSLFAEWANVSASAAVVQSSRKNCVRAATGESATTSRGAESPKTLPGLGAIVKDRVKHIHTVEEFDVALKAAKNKLVVVEYAASYSANSHRIYPAMVELSKACQDVVFLLVVGDETEATKELCTRAGVEKVPHFVFYKNEEVIHEEGGIGPELLEGDVLYYGDNDAPIYQVRNKKDFDVLLKEHASDSKLVVLDVGLKNCGPCVKVYPTVVKLSKKMADNTVFARMHGDENEDCMELLRSMDVIEVPTFIFIRDGRTLGRYVGSGKGELIGEILRYNGVRVTY
ncbi:hypothetical protein R1sor_007181 [Riccia sorocarpa]|uniref:Thioredoxin domain-containing protein n=1 Tax=Riccia sorocarpa TaxID=122646 RepID=A0ABD3HTX2_9MARC